MKWFNNPQTLEELKKQYKQLAIKHHPDMGGSTQDMQEINAEYEMWFKKFTTEETTETSEEYRIIIETLINLEGIEIEICGTWVWITGDTKPHKETLKGIGFKWASKKHAWYWHSEGYKKMHKGNYTLDEIREMHGSQKVRTEHKTRIAIE